MMALRMGRSVRIILIMNKLEAFGHIAALAIRGELVFPTSVNAALRVQLALDDPECPVDKAIGLVLAEPLLAARTVAIANSAMFNRSGAPVITNVRGAIMRIGYQNLFALAAAMVVRQFGSKITDPKLRAKAEALWDHTIAVAALARLIARYVTGVNEDTALFAGIVHEVGGFYLLSRAAEFPGLLDGGADEWIEHGEVAIGRGVLVKLGVPAPVMGAIEAMWNGMRALPPETLGDTLLLANDLCPVASPLLERPAVAGLQASATIDFTVGAGTLASILAESAEEVRSLGAALS